MPEFPNLQTFKGRPLTLVGDAIAVGDVVPDFRVARNLSEDVSLSSTRGKVVVLSVAPSVDTGVCAMQLRAFNQRAVELGEDAIIWYVSMDLPFALSRFCAAEGIQRVATYSDFRHREAGARLGVLVKEFGLLARAVFVIGRDGRLVYREIVPEFTHEPNYDAALAAVKSALV